MNASLLAPKRTFTAAALLLLALAGGGAAVGRFEDDAAAQTLRASCAEHNASPRPVRAGIAIAPDVRPVPLFDGVQAWIEPLVPASGLVGCEQISGLVAIGAVRNFAAAYLTARAAPRGFFMPKYGWITGGVDTTAPLVVGRSPWPARSGHLYRIRRLRPSTPWVVEIDGRVVGGFNLPGSTRGLPAPSAELYTTNNAGGLNRGSFRFQRVMVLPAHGRRWTEFPRGRTILFTTDTRYTYTKLPRRTQFIAKSR
jgi:hypothetical protein